MVPRAGDALGLHLMLEAGLSESQLSSPGNVSGSLPQSLLIPSQITACVQLGVALLPTMRPSLYHGGYL